MPGVSLSSAVSITPRQSQRGEIGAKVHGSLAPSTQVGSSSQRHLPLPQGIDSCPPVDISYLGWALCRGKREVCTNLSFVCVTAQPGFCVCSSTSLTPSPVVFFHGTRGRRPEVFSHVASESLVTLLPSGALWSGALETLCSAHSSHRWPQGPQFLNP